LLGALRNGCTKVELKELFLHAALYCGFPAAQEGIRALRKVAAEYEADARKGD
jgi:4-carboxymuconolactone decarboxylase